MAQRIPSTYRSLIALHEARIEELQKDKDLDVTKQALSYLCDIVLSTVHRHDQLRDAVVDTRYNPQNKSILFKLNPSLTREDLLKLGDLIKGIPEVHRMAYAQRTENGHVLRVVKIQGVGFDVTPEDRLAPGVRHAELSGGYTTF